MTTRQFCRSDQVLASDQAQDRRHLAAIAYSEVARHGSMKMGTTRSPCPYDAGACRALQPVKLRRPAISRYASWDCLPDFAGLVILREWPYRAIPGLT
jgi:hypothetical protein